MSDTFNAPIETLARIIRVKQLNFSLNEKIADMNPSKLVETKLNHTFGFNADINFVNFTITFFIHYADSPLDAKLAEITVENIFEVFDLKKYVVDNVALLPENILIEIVSASTSHARALFSQGIAGTPYQNIVIPLADQRRIAALLFPGSIQLTQNDYDFMQKIREKNDSTAKKTTAKAKK